jgi:hypothetical protein
LSEVFQLIYGIATLLSHKVEAEEDPVEREGTALNELRLDERVAVYSH